MRRLLFLILTIAISSGAYRYHETVATHDPPAIRTAKPRRWSFVIPGWQPTPARRFERLNDDERMQARRADRWAVREIRVPDDAGKLVVSLFVRLGKGQHRGGDYWAAILDALQGVGIVAKSGEVEFDSERGVDRDDVETTVELRGER